MKRILLGLGAVVLVGTPTSLENPSTTEVVSDASTFRLWWTLEHSGRMLVAWFIGGLVAQRSFVLPAAVVSVIGSGGVIWVSWELFPDSDIFWLLKESAISLAAGILVAVVGAFLGQRFYVLLRQPITTWS